MRVRTEHDVDEIRSAVEARGASSVIGGGGVNYDNFRIDTRT